MKKQCYRHTATPSKWQSYFAKPPFKLDETTHRYECDYYWPNEDHAPQGTPPTSRGRWEGEF